MSPEIVTQVVTNLGVLTVLAWYMYYNVTVTIPNIVKLHTDAEEKVSARFAESSEKKSALFAETQKAISDNFASTLKEERLYRREEIDTLKQWFRTEASCKYPSDKK